MRYFIFILFTVCAGPQSFGAEQAPKAPSSSKTEPNSVTTTTLPEPPSGSTKPATSANAAAASPAAAAVPASIEDDLKHPCHQERMMFCQNKLWKNGVAKCLAENEEYLGKTCKARVAEYKLKHPDVKK